MSAPQTLRLITRRPHLSAGGRGRTAQRCRAVLCRAEAHLSRRAAIAAPLALLPLHAQQAGAASTATAGAAAAEPWAFPRRQLLSLLSVSSDYNRYAASYDTLDGGALPQALGFDELRAALISQASGDVLETAVGTGLNLPLYDPARLTSLTAVDISPGMLSQAAGRADELARRVAGSSGGSSGAPGQEAGEGSPQQQQQQQQQQGPVRLMVADAAALPFSEGSFDCVVDTFSLCVFERPAAAVAEMGRVLRRGGRLLLLEHTRSDNPLLGAYQDVTNSAVQPLSKGCAWNQDVAGYVTAAGLRIVTRRPAVAGTVALIVAERP